MNSIDLSVEFAGIQMQNPIMPASGCFGFGEELEKAIDISCLGAIVSKGTTLEPKEGNPQPRVWETASGMINRIGLENPGIKKVIAEKIPFMAKFGIPVIINISGNKFEEYIEMTEMLDAALRDRFYVIAVEYLPPQVEAEVLNLKTHISDTDAVTLVNIVNKLRTNTQMPISVSTRHTLMMAEMVKIGAPIREAVIYSLQMGRDLLESILLSYHVTTGEKEVSTDGYETY